MKRLLMITVFVGLLTSVAFAGPTPYARVNLEYRSVDRDAVNSPGLNSKYVKDAGIQDVGNGATRLGVKSSIMAGPLKAGYVLEAGFPVSAGGAVTMRYAYAYFAGKFGTVKAGLTDAATNLVGFYIDPIGTTGLGAIGATQAGYFSMAELDRLGQRYRNRFGLVGYQTPTIAGLNLLITVDRDNQANYTSATPVYSTEALLSFAKKFGGAAVNAYLGYGMNDDKRKQGGTEWGFTQIGAKVAVKGFRVGALMSMEESISGVAVETKVETDRLHLNVGYAMGPHSVTLTHNAKDYKSVTTPADTSNDYEATQLALMYQWKPAKGLSLRAGYGKAEVKYATKNPANDAEGTVMLVGTTLTF